MTTRDAVWNAVISKLVEEGRFKIGDLDIPEEKRHTVRRVLKEMEDMGYLERKKEYSHTYRAGELAKLHFDLSDKARVMADLDE